MDSRDYPTTKWSGLPLPDMARPAFMMPSVAELVRNRKCPTCKKDICPTDFAPWHARERAEYSISGMCMKCQANVFTPAPKADDEPDTVALMRGLHKIQERGGTAQDEERFLRLAGFKMKHYCSIGECEPVKEVEGPNCGCDECFKSIYSVPAEEPMKSSTPPPSEGKKGVINPIPGAFYQCYAGYTCSLCGPDNIVFIDDEDKHETWGCSKCKAESWFRVRRYDMYGDEL